MKLSDSLALSWFAALGVVTFLTFGFDKWQASRSGRRVPEVFLLLLGAIGGWPGGVLGMAALRHKTAQWRFLIKYGLGLIPFALEVWGWLHWR